MDDFITCLAGKLSTGARLLMSPGTPDFKASMERWSNIDVQVPFTIIQPAEESDIVATVQGAVKAGIPFVPASGGHSPWSAIGQEGIIVDLGR